MAKVSIDGIVREAGPNELLIDLLNRADVTVPHVCYHPQLGPVQTCDTCMVEADGRLIRACATEVADGMNISTKSKKAAAAQVEAFDRILSNHLLYCTVCDNNNGNCTVHNTTTPQNYLPLSISVSLFDRSRMRLITPIRSTGTIRINASCVAAALRPARTSR